MIIVFLRGGLGNQMFQYALGLNLAKKNGSKLLLDKTFLNDRFPRKEFAYRTYDLGVFALSADFTSFSRVSAAIPVPGLWIGLDLALIKIKEILGIRRVVREKNERFFERAVLDERGKVMLFGRWQTEKYFSEVAGDVRAAFRFKNKPVGEAAIIADQIEKKNSVSLHVRRGDYAAFKGVEQLHGKTDLGYYGRAAQYMADHISNPYFFVFSDDIPWCRENLKIKFPMTFVEQVVAGPHSSYHLELMSLCKHNIVANSTFSWWGAWLNANPEKIVVAPSRWYADGKGDGDIVPASWIKL